MPDDNPPDTTAAARLPPVVLTREAADNAPLAALLGAAGFAVLECPAMATELLLPPGGSEASDWFHQVYIPPPLSFYPVVSQ